MPPTNYRPIVVPSLESANPQLAVETARLVEFQHRLASVEVDIGSLAKAISTDAEKLNAERLSALLDNPQLPVDTALGKQALTDQLERLRAMRRDLVEVERLQRDRIAKERLAASDAILRDIQNSHDALAAEVAAALAALVSVSSVYMQLLSDLSSTGVVGVERLDALAIGQITGWLPVNDGRAAEVLRTALRKGLLPLRDLPAGVRSAG